MSPGLRIVAGPPNSGRAGVVMSALRERACQRPLLVVPAWEDVERFELELAGAGQPVLGTTVMMFESLAGLVASESGAAPAAELGRNLRRHLVGAAIRSVGAGCLGGQAPGPGVIDAVDRAISELQAERVPAGGQPPDGGDERLRATLAAYTAYAELCAGAGLADERTRTAQAATALRSNPGGWAPPRPVLLYGFEDLSPLQISLLEALHGAGAELIVSATADPGRPALAARDRLIAMLREIEAVEVERLPATTEYLGSAGLAALDSGLMADEPAGCEDRDGLEVIEAPGRLEEAEAVAGRVAALIDAGTEPREIAVVARTASRSGRLLGETLARFGVPVAVHARIPLHATATGRALISLARLGSGNASVADLLIWLRSPGGGAPGWVDYVEHRIARGRIREIGDALDLLDGGGRVIDGLAETTGSSEFARRLARQARRTALANHPHDAPLLDWNARIECLAARCAHDALGDLANSPAGVPEPARIAAELAALEVDLWRGSASNRVRVGEPAQLRAARFDHVFITGMVENEFPRPGAVNPLLTDRDRELLGIGRRAEADAEERYQFASAVALARNSLTLSWNSGDTDETRNSRSPFLDEVGRALDPLPATEADPLAAITVTPEPVIVVPGGDPEAALARAGTALERATLPRPSPSGPVAAELGGRETFSPSGLEGYLTCPYKWFVDRLLRPEDLEGESEQLTRGSLAHEALERIYAGPPAGTIPAPATVGAWLERAERVLAEVETELEGPPSAARMALLADVRSRVLAFVEREARSDRVQPDEVRTEFSFGREDDEHGAADLGEGLRLSGKADRVDLIAGNGGPWLAIRDYKQAFGLATIDTQLRERRIQALLYMAAVEQLLGPSTGAGGAAALYEPLAEGADATPRGAILDEAREAVIGGIYGRRSAGVDAATLETKANEALDLARKAATGIRSARILRAPNQGRCPSYCTYQAICRIEHGPDEDADG